MSVASGRPPMRHVLCGLISALVLALQLSHDRSNDPSHGSSARTTLRRAPNLPALRRLTTVCTKDQSPGTMPITVSCNPSTSNTSST